jgi:hypothetical protein
VPKTQSVQVTNELLAGYKGGQMELYGGGPLPLYRGKVDEAMLSDGHLLVFLNWLARFDDFDGWVAASRDKTFLFRVQDCRLSVDPDNRVWVNCNAFRQVAIFYPPGGSRLDPQRVKGLVVS